MIKQSLIQGYTALDNCYKYTDSDSTIDCYAFTRDALSKPLKTAEPALNTNLVYALIGQQNNKEHGIADDRELQRKYDNGELGDGITITENGDIIIE